MTTNIGLGYEAQLVNQVLQVRLIGDSAWTTVDSPVTEAKYRLDGGGTYVRLHYIGPWYGPGNSSTGNTTSTASFASNRSGSSSDWINDAGSSPSIPPTTTPPAPVPNTDPVFAFETHLNVTAHQIRNLADGTEPKDAINLSQLTNAVSALTTAYQAGDTANATAIDAINIAIANLPSGITMAQVQTAIEASVAEAVLNEVIDDAQKQAIVDAALAQLSTIDTAVIGRVGATETAVADLTPRVVALEAADVAQDASIGALEAADANHAAQLAALTTQNLQRIATDDAHAFAISQLQTRDAEINQSITPVKVSIVNGAVSAAVGVAANMVTIDATNATHMQVTIDLGTSNPGKDRDGNVYRLLASGVKVKIGAAPAQMGEAYTFAFLKESLGSTSVQIVLN